MIKGMKQLFRLLRIYWIIARYGIDKIILKHRYFKMIYFISFFNPWNWRYHPKYTRGEAIRKALEDLGPVFVKFGQTLSTRRDLLPDDIANELAKLQDRVPPFNENKALKILEKEYQQSHHAIFSTFETTPIASASIAQVHAATLSNGKDVVVKILRPNIKKQIKQDVSIMYLLANIAARYLKKSKQLKAKQIVAEFEFTILGELDLLREAASASQLRRNFTQRSTLYVPEIHWDYCTHHVMVMERIYGIPIRDKGQLQEYGFDLKKLAELGLEIFFTQVFQDCFFHADMHPGNIFISTKNIKHPKFIAVDFGIMGSLSKLDQRYIAENLLAFFKRDYRRVAILHLESGWAPPHTRVDQLEMAIRAVCEPIFEKPLGEISFGQLLLRLFQMASTFEIEIQPQLILLQKTLLNVEGLGRDLYPKLDLWQTAKPFLENWIKKQVGPRAFIQKIQTETPRWLEQLPELPDLIYFGLKRLKETPIIPHNTQTIVKSNHGFWLGFFSAATIGVIFTAGYWFLRLSLFG